MTNQVSQLVDCEICIKFSDIRFSYQQPDHCSLFQAEFTTLKVTQYLTSDGVFLEELLFYLNSKTAMKNSLNLRFLQDILDYSKINFRKIQSQLGTVRKFISGMMQSPQSPKYYRPYKFCSISLAVHYKSAGQVWGRTHILRNTTGHMCSAQLLLQQQDLFKFARQKAVLHT